MRMNLQGYVVFITGGGSSLGEGIAQAVTEKGAAVVLADINTDSAKKVADKLKVAGHKAIVVKMDVTNENDIQRTIEEAEAAMGKIDVLVNNAGITKMQNIEDISKQDWDTVFAINVCGLFRCCQVFADIVKKKNASGKIINIASNAAKVTFPGQAHYNASKAAVTNMTQSLAKELAPAINVNAVCPGAVDTEMLKSCMVQTIESDLENKNMKISDLREAWSPPQLGRLIQPIEVGRVVAFLASDDALIIRGQSISVDAGNTPY